MIRINDYGFSFIFLWVTNGLFEFSIFKIENESKTYEFDLFMFCYCCGDIFITIFGKEFTLREK